jgi:hypothetical protein
MPRAHKQAIRQRFRSLCEIVAPERALRQGFRGRVGMPICSGAKEQAILVAIKMGWAVSPSSEQVSAAIERLPSQSNAAIARVLENARARLAHELVRACETELAARGALQLSEEQARQAVAAQVKVKDKGLREVIEIAFQDVPLSYPEEAWVIRELTANPGIRYANLELSYVARFSKNDLSLVVGHLVYNRFGYFRHLIQSKTQSDLLIERGNDGGVTYCLRAETLDAFRGLNLVPEGD